MPRLQVVLEAAPRISMAYETSEGVSEEYSSEESESFETSHEVSNSLSETYASEYGWSVEVSAGVEFEWGTNPGARLSFGVAVGGYGSYTNEDSYTWESSQSVSNQQAYTRAYSLASEESKTQTGGEIAVPVTIVNEGNIAYTINSLSLTAYNISPESDGDLGRVIGALESEGDVSITLSPGSSSGILNFQNDSLTVSEVMSLLADSRSVVCAVAGYSISMTSDEGTTDFSFEGTTVSAQTAKVTVDYGPNVFNTDGSLKKARQFNVATRTKYNPDYTSVDDRYDSLYLSDIMESLYLDYEEGSSGGNTGLLSVSGVENDLDNNKCWYVIHFRNRGDDSTGIVYAVTDMSCDFETIEVRTGDVVEFIYSEDQDQDGLPVRMEELLGTSDETPDSDEDGLTDYEELNGWASALVDETFTSNPALADTDQDGLLDPDDSEPSVVLLSDDASIVSCSVNGTDADLESSEMIFEVNDDNFTIRVEPSSAVLDVEIAGVYLTKIDSYYEGVIDIPVIGVTDYEVVVTALDNQATFTYGFQVDSELAPVGDFRVTGIDDSVDSVRLYWTIPDDSRVTHMLIVRREDAAVSSISPDYYEAGDAGGGGVVLEKYTVNAEFETEVYTDSGLTDGTTYHYCAINVREEDGNIYYFSEAYLDSASTETLPPGDLTFRLFYFEDIDDNDGTTTPDSEVYWNIYATYNSVQTPLSSLTTSYVGMDDNVGELNHYYEFDGGITSTLTGSYMDVDLTNIAREDGETVYVNVGIFEYDSTNFDQGAGNDEVFINTQYSLTYTKASDTWTCNEQPGLTVGSDTVLSYTGTAGTIKFKIGVYWTHE